MKPTKNLRWNRLEIAREFGMDARTVGKRLAESDLDAKETFSTKEVFAAMMGDLGMERIRLTREQADKVALENAKERGELVDARSLAERVNKAISAIKAHIQSSTLEREDKDKILLACRGLWEDALCSDGAGVESPAPLHGESVE